MYYYFDSKTVEKIRDTVNWVDQNKGQPLLHENYRATPTADPGFWAELIAEVDDGYSWVRAIPQGTTFNPYPNHQGSGNAFEANLLTGIASGTITRLYFGGFDEATNQPFYNFAYSSALPGSGTSAYMVLQIASGTGLNYLFDYVRAV